jgi:hypothetical protein
MLVRFKRKPEEQGPKKAPVPMPSRDPDWDHRKVDAGEPKRRLKAFEQKQEYVAIIEYREKAKSGGPRIQKLGFKAEGGFLNATRAAYNIATMIGKAIAVDLHEIRHESLCRVLAVYELKSFKDWEKENVTDAKRNSHIEKAIERSKNDKANPVKHTTVKDIRVR